MSSFILRDFPRGEEELQAKRQLLESLRTHVALCRRLILDLEGELGDVLCAACGKAHAGRCLESD